MTQDAVIYVVDDDSSVRRGLGRIFRSAGYAVKALSSAREFLEHKRLADGCLVLDVQMPGLNGLDLQDELSRMGQSIPIIFISGQGEIPDAVRALKAGAEDFLSKPVDGDDLIKAVQRALAKGRTLTKVRKEQRTVQSRIERLTARERQVLQWVVSGRLNKQIAFKLGISEKTVKVHRGRVMEKMRARSVADLVRQAEKIPLS